MIEFTVYGKPQPAGSKRGFNVGGKVVITDDNRKAKPWKALVTEAALDQMEAAWNGGAERALLAGPLTVEATFYTPRPKSHYRTGRYAGELRPGCPLYPAVKPDSTKLFRAVEDALTGVVWRDDAQVVNQWVRKMYGEPARCEVRITELDNV